VGPLALQPLLEQEIVSGSGISWATCRWYINSRTEGKKCMLVLPAGGSVSVYAEARKKILQPA